MEINWISIITVLLLTISFVSGSTTAYLSLFIDRKLSTAKEQIFNHIDEKFALKETMDIQFKTLQDDIKDLKDELKIIKSKQ